MADLEIAVHEPWHKSLITGLFWLISPVKASGNVDNEGLIGRAREDHRFGFRRANIFRQYQAELGLLLAAMGAQQRHNPKHFSFAIPRSRWS